jgi:hypothetical protein
MGELGLGRFGDLRLEKGGPFYTGGWWKKEAEVFGFVGSGKTEQARSG